MNIKCRFCPLCGSANGKKLLAFQDDVIAHAVIQLVRCADCRMVFLDRACDPATEQQYYSNHVSKRFQAMPSAEDLDREYLRQIPVLNQAVHQLPSPGGAEPRVLDVGCGSGFLLHRLRESGWATQGIDLDTDCVAFCRETLGLQVSLQSINDFASPQKFNAVIMTDVFEHFPDPVHVLKKLHGLLASSGVLVIKVPNWNFGQIHKLRAMGKKRFQPNLHIQTEHLNYFDPGTLRKALRSAGFAQVSCKPASSTYTSSDSGFGFARAALRSGLRRVLYAASNVAPSRLICSPCFFGMGSKLPE